MIARCVALLGLSVLVPPSASCAGTPEAEARPAADRGIRFADEVVLSNGVVDVAVAGQVGRIVHFGYTGGPNLLWRADREDIEKQRGKDNPGWINYGGDKVWPSLQSSWSRQHGAKGWPPDTTADGAAWEVERVGERKLRMRSPVSPHLNVRIVREVELDAAGARVVVRNAVERTDWSPFPVHVWSVSQTVMPRYTLAGVSRKRPQLARGGEYHALWTYGDKDKVSGNITVLADGRAIRWDMDHQGGGKTGTLGTWGACVFDDVVLVHQTSYDPEGAYPDASNIQLYTHGEYTELETLSPQSHPKVGEAIRNTVVWTLLPREDRDDAALVEAIEALPAVAQPE